MDVYKVIPASYSALQPKDSEEYQVVLGLSAFTGRPMLARWRHIALEATDPQQLVTDFFYFGLGGLAFPRRTLDVFSSMFTNAGEVLPFEMAGTTFYALNVLRRVDCLNAAQSEVKRLGNGTVVKIDRYAFHSSAVAGETLFLIPEEISSLFTVFNAADPLKSFFQTYSDRKMTGLVFQKVWSGTDS